MTRWIVAGLVVLNLLLGAGMYMRFGGERSAQAQIGGGGSDYAVVSGFNNNQTLLYIMEVRSGNMVVVRTDPVNHKAELAAIRRVGEDLAGTR